MSTHHPDTTSQEPTFPGSQESSTNPDMLRQDLFLPGSFPLQAPRSNRRSSPWWIFGAFLVFLLFVSLALSWWRFGPQAFAGETKQVIRQKLQFKVVERGTLESQFNSEIICKVKSGARGGTIATTIKWVIDDGTPVKKDQPIIELDAAGLEVQLGEQNIKVDNANAARIQADENWKIIESQNQSDIETAKVAVEIKKLALRKYLGQNLDYKEGEYLQAKNDLLGKIETAKSDLDLWQDKASWSQRMLKRGFVTRSQADADQSRLENAQIALRKAEGDLEILEKFTKRLTETDLRSQLDEAERALARVLIQAEAKKIQAMEDKRNKLSVYNHEKNLQEDIQSEIAKCYIRAPQDGLVTYYMPEQSRYGGGSQQSIVAQGEPVREGQKLMLIPNLKKMQVNVRVHEAMVRHLKGEKRKSTGFYEGLFIGLHLTPHGFQRLGQLGSWSESQDMLLDQKKSEDKNDLRWPRLDDIVRAMKAEIRVEADPGKVLHGHVKSVANVASQAEFFSSDVKVYQTIVTIDEVVKNLKPGMSAEVTVYAEETADEVLTIPLQSVVNSFTSGPMQKCFVVNERGLPEERAIELGGSNEQWVEVKSGLMEGDRVVLNPRSIPGIRSEPTEKAPGKKGKTSPQKSKSGKGSKGPVN